MSIRSQMKPPVPSDNAPVDVPTVTARLRHYPTRVGPLDSHYFWRVERCPHCRDTQHEHAIAATEEAARQWLGVAIKAACYRSHKKDRWYVLAEAQPAVVHRPGGEVR